MKFNISELIFPARCPICDRVLALGEIICNDCRARVKPLKGAFCRKCGRLLKDERGEYCGECQERQHLYHEGRILYDYKDIRASIYRFKYMGRRDYASFYGREMAKELGSCIKSWGPDAIVPVPLHPRRAQKRGYNQALLISKALGKHLNIPVRDDIVKRVVDTKPMKSLNMRQRENNLKRAFKIDSDVVKLNVIVLLDDIYTTGSTIDAISRVFLEKGVRRIYYTALAIAGS